MKLTLRNALPNPMAEAPPEKSEVWRQEVIFEPSDRCLVIGESGRGKTTFMHMLCGIRRDYQGEVLLDDRDAKELSPTDWATLRAKRLGLMYQDLRLFPELTPRENLSLLPAREQGCPETGEMAERLGMTDFLDRPCGQLSQGQRQRIAVMRVLCRPFSFLLLDEPFSHLDNANVKAMAALIDEEIERRGAGLIFASLGKDTPFDGLRVLRL
jgi:putative ABC transport system ATP-binding protein